MNKIWLQMWQTQSGNVLIEMDQYHAANLLAALQAIRNPDTPLKVLETGDWVGELQSQLENLAITRGPNVPADEIIVRARAAA